MQHLEIEPESLQWYWKEHGSKFETLTSSNRSGSILDTGLRWSNYHILANPRCSGFAQDHSEQCSQVAMIAF